MFTLTQLLEGTNFPKKVKFRKWLGRSIVRSYRAKYNQEPDKHVEYDSQGNRYEVMLYPDSFRDRAQTIVHRYFRSKLSKKYGKWDVRASHEKPKRKRRRRIVKNSAPKFEKVNRS